MPPEGPPQPGPPVSKTEYVLARLRDDISSGRLAPGQFLAQTELATRYSVSATPVREALRALEAEGAITYTQHRGASVTELTDENISDHYELRAAVESIAVKLTMQRHGTGVAEKAQAVQDQLVAGVGTLSPAQLSELNHQFHHALCAGASRVVTDMANALTGMLPQRHRGWSDLAVAREFISQHQVILAAVRAGDAEAAAREMSAHILHAFTVGLASTPEPTAESPSEPTG